MRDRHTYPAMLLSMFSGEFCLRLKRYLVVEISSDVVTEHCCPVCVLAMMFCHSDYRLCAGMCGKWLRNHETPRTTCFGLLTLRQTNMIYEKYSLHLIFKFYLNRDTSVLELFSSCYVVIYHSKTNWVANMRRTQMICSRGVYSSRCQSHR